MKLTRKLIPVNIYDIPKMQAYLSDMAAKGYFLKKLNAFAYFEKDSPKNVTYRLDPMAENEKRPEKEQVEKYKDIGWEYVCTIKKSFHIYRSDESSQKEIHRDLERHSRGLEYLNKNMNIAYMVSIILMILVIITLINSTFLTESPLLDVIKYGDISYKIMISLLALTTVKRTRDNRKNIKLILNSLKRGSHMAQKSTYKTNYNTYVLDGMLIIFSVLTIVSSFIMINNNWDEKLSSYKGDLPVIELSDIEKTESLEIKEDRLAYNRISYSWTELAPSIYEIEQIGVDRNRMWEDKSGNYSPSLSTEFYKLRFSFLSDNVLEELIDDSLKIYRYQSIYYREILNTKFDRAIFVKSEDTQMFFASLENNIIYINYHGYENLELYSDNIYNSLRNFKNKGVRYGK